ncbi:MAG: peptide-modifying radical SAM enzyme CbpB [Lentisphaerae bacterium RIFOXYC12_FULL_60_16]|nr:MAG: peptide-modifying radical SAM enzyme CbpB [Lentisphaerae bacterium RIFOXYC12_FULL_60_16]OGV84913.1 MAG: peptide-modifying radical SAM enzyme CbpB [Lentisphaerae bacterium RIFOXYB12_FULL_60_10]
MHTRSVSEAAPSRGRFLNTGNGPHLQPLDIGHDSYVALIEPDTAFWSLVRKDALADTLANPSFRAAVVRKQDAFATEMHALRFGLKPSAVYFNPTERCNLNCRYCYIPETMRKHGRHMSQARMFEALERLKRYFKTTMPKGRLPQVVFHGAEPMLNREALFAAIERYGKSFRFGVQTNATLLDDSAIAFLTERGIGIGLSLDAPLPAVANRTRRSWNGEGVFEAVETAMRKLKGYPGFNVICTVTRENLQYLVPMVEFLHAHEAPACMLNIVRCTLPGARTIKPDDAAAAKAFLAALDRTHLLFKRTGRKLVVANFANVLVSILAPTARRLMCDISPCGGGRCFFALAPDGGLYPCSEFIGLKEFRGGNLFKDHIADVLKSPAFTKVTGRKVEAIEPCNQCAIRHFCGAPCPAEAHAMNGGMHRTGAFCEFYEEQVRYAFRLIANGIADDYLWDGWDRDAETTFDWRG